MRLPGDNSLDLGRVDRNDGLVDNGEPVALSDADVLALLPEWVRRSPGPLRDAVVSASRRFWSHVQARVGSYLGALQTPRNADGLRLAEHGEMRHRPQAPLEDEAAYRERLLVRPARITPRAIREAVTALVLAQAPIAPVLFEPATEGVFVQAEGEYAWTCFVQQAGSPPIFAEMPDNDIPAGVWLGAEADVTRPVFVALLQGELSDLPDAWHVLTEGATSAAVQGDFVGDDAGPVAWGFVTSETPPLEEQVVREVEARRGGGVIWWLHVVPNLGGAL